MKTRSQLKKEQDRLLKILQNVTPLIKKYPNVKEIGIGIKEKNGELTKELCIKIVVSEKIKKENLNNRDIIPSHIEGVVTDITEEEDKVPLCNSVDKKIYRPVIGGVMINNIKNGNSTRGFGTLGCFAKRNSDQSWVLLSNHHVLYSSKGEDNDLIGQPWVRESLCQKPNIIASNCKGDLATDSAIAVINDQTEISNSIAEVGNIKNGATAQPVIAEQVIKRGARTKLTKGVVTFYNPTKKEITITADKNYRVFAYYGDSGSVIINSNNEITALLFAGSRFSDKIYAKEISAVEKALDITITTTKNCFGQKSDANKDEIYHELHFECDTHPTTHWPASLSKHLKEVKNGSLFLKIISQHEKEIFSLINNNRAVIRTWQIKEGPAFIRAIGECVNNVNQDIPQDINSVSLYNLIISMAAVLEENCSSSLKKDIQKYSPPFLDIIYKSKNLKEFIAAVEKAKCPDDSSN
ncbi:hypothetical protein QA597_01720 [Marinilabiliaceae bacterium ANBcel2]|nr:hypothetical protein [Marinilabiliaceae bacterium ANBcel2]